METYGARCIASPSNETESGRAILAQDANSPGSLGIAISEAVEVAAKDPAVKYALGSVLNHVLLHQTVNGLEAIKQFEMAGDDPDIVIGCVGGGSNFAGIAFPYLGMQLRGGRERRFIAVEPASCPTMTRGKYAYDFGDTAHLTPLVKMHTLGSTFIPPSTHSGGLRYHGMAPLISHVYELGLIEARAYQQTACFDAAVQFARCEGIVPAPESTHAVRCAIDEALRWQAGRQGRNHPVQPVRPRPFRHGRLHRLFRGQAHRPSLRRSRTRHGACRAAQRRGLTIRISIAAGVSSSRPLAEHRSRALPFAASPACARIFSTC